MGSREARQQRGEGKAASTGASPVGTGAEFYQGDARVVENTSQKDLSQGARELGYLYTKSSQSLLESCSQGTLNSLALPACCIHWFQKTPLGPGVQSLAARGQQVDPEGHARGPDSIRLGHGCAGHVWALNKYWKN